ncbi:hypothetical protein ACFZCP_27355 [Streptomyces sp. NPDC007971]|uniref:hypothetical protein n=1 Tax=Streptomyces sp. NPDC007971 TaxID=3364799 RepID=UPI0036E4227F
MAENLILVLGACLVLAAALLSGAVALLVGIFTAWDDDRNVSFGKKLFRAARAGGKAVGVVMGVLTPILVLLITILAMRR